MLLSIERGDFDIEVRENQRLALNIAGRDWRHESDVHLQLVFHVHGENTLGRRVLERCLVDSFTARQSHPSVNIAVNTDETAPPSHLVPSHPLLAHKYT